MGTRITVLSRLRHQATEWTIHQEKQAIFSEERTAARYSLSFWTLVTCEMIAYHLPSFLPKRSRKRYSPLKSLPLSDPLIFAEPVRAA
jgi:hypothetical protein